MRVLVTGASGRLGRELVPLLRAAGIAVMAPTHSELDLLDAPALQRYFGEASADLVVHLAGYTNVARAETDHDACWQGNVVATRNVARAVQGRLIHVSTDYVFDGTRGMYREGDVPVPINYYAVTKLVSEEAARAAPDHLIIRTSFKPSLWPHAVAFHDQYTSADYVDVIARGLAELVAMHDSIRPRDNILHVATERKSVYELARRRNPNVRPASRLEAPVKIPLDVSLDVSRLQGLKLAPGRDG